jgi:hypothetical protein
MGRSSGESPDFVYESLDWDLQTEMAELADALDSGS